MAGKTGRKVEIMKGKKKRKTKEKRNEGWVEVFKKRNGRLDK